MVKITQLEVEHLIGDYNIPYILSSDRITNQHRTPFLPRRRSVQRTSLPKDTKDAATDDMESGSLNLLESVTLKTLHAHNFHRASSEATHVLTDLLSRYVTLLATTCAQYAEHAGKNHVSVRDAVMALDELGVSFEELVDYGEVDGREMSRYAISTARREEELSVLRGPISFRCSGLYLLLISARSFAHGRSSYGAERFHPTHLRTDTQSFRVRR